LADDVPDKNVHLLDAGSGGRRYAQAKLAHRFQLSSADTRQPNNLHAPFLGHLSRPQDVGTVAACGDGHQRIARAPQGFLLPNKDLLVPVVVSHSG